MKIRDLITELTDLYPQAFPTGETKDAWGRKFRDVLVNFEGPKLQRAWDELQARWNKPGPPKPADVLTILKEWETPINGKKPTLNLREKAEYVTARVPELMRMAIAEYRGRDIEDDCAFLASQLATRYAQAEWLHDKGAMNDEVFATFRYKLDDVDEALAIHRLYSRKSWGKGKKFKTAFSAAESMFATEGE